MVEAKDTNGRKIMSDSVSVVQLSPEAPAVCRGLEYFEHLFECHFTRIEQRGGRPVYVAIAPITPHIAARLLLERNTRNRPQGASHIATLRGLALAGQWRMTGQPVIIDWDDVLLDGQHRLEAIFTAGETDPDADLACPALIVYGVDPAVFPHIDRARSRSLADNAALNHVEYARLVSPAVPVLQGFLASGRLSAA